MADEGSGARLCCRVLHRYDLRPAREAVNNREEVGLVFRGWEGADDVNMDAAKASVWRRPRSERGVDMALDLRGLAGMAFLAPAADITLEAVPDKTGGDSSLCWLASGMRESVDGLKDTPCPRRRNDGSVFSGGDVAEDGNIPERDVSEAEAGSGSLVGSDLIRIHLIVGQATVVDRRESDHGQTIGTGQGVGDNICLAFDVAHVRGELGDEGEVSGLPR